MMRINAKPNSKVVHKIQTVSAKADFYGLIIIFEDTDQCTKTQHYHTMKCSSITSSIRSTRR